jgi:hypothetical protein
MREMVDVAAEDGQLAGGGVERGKARGALDADVKQFKALLAVQIIKALDKDGLTVRTAHTRTGSGLFSNPQRRPRPLHARSTGGHHQNRGYLNVERDALRAVKSQQK